mgnify:CR=1 FL=1
MNKKIVLGFLLFTLLIIGGGVLLANNLPSNTARTLGVKIEKTPGAKVEIPETTFDFKNVSYSGGNIEHKFLIKNAGDKELKIANLKTSCMCTTVSFKSIREQSPTFGMEGHSKTVDWTGVLKPQEEGEMIVIFNPTAHGPQGVGPFSRFASFETNDPDHPYIELSINGTVVKD